MSKTINTILLLFGFSFITVQIFGQAPYEPKHERLKIKLSHDWRFSLGHATDASKDFNTGTGYFSYLAKTGYGDGAASALFDDRAWRKVDVPHDWVVELPFVADGGHSHGYRAVGRNYPENSVGWYRKTFEIPESDLGKKISIEFDGVHRNSIVWVNGFYLGTEPSGYKSFAYDISDYLNYGGKNVIAVRADITMEEGWYYEGGGIVRHVWLLKTAPLHVDRYGTFITSELEDGSALLSNRTTIINEGDQAKKFTLQEEYLDQEGNVIASNKVQELELKSLEEKTYYTRAEVKNPKLWSIDAPNMHTLVTRLYEDERLVDEYHTDFGIRSVHFDPDKGFFLNGEPVKILGTNMHKDHAGVGRAIPNALHEFRIKTLQTMGSNAVRTAHDPPSPDFLDACDRMGFMVLDENRLMGINQQHFDALEDLIKRDRNHPSIILWSLGNEEWAIEGNEKGARIAKTMQDFAQKLDSSRAFTTALSGGWDYGIGSVMEVIGYNYIIHGDIDGHHEKFPWQPSVGTEETTTQSTRGIYVTNDEKCHLAPQNTNPEKPGTEYGWNFYNDREFLSGLFYWTGFDYRGEPTPYAWPAVSSQFGMIDLCGFPKDIYYYLQSWWSEEPVIHIATHWNWPEDQGEEKEVTVYSNAKEVELFLDGRSLGKKEMPANGHLKWKVKYKPGVLAAKGYSEGKVTSSTSVETTGSPEAVRLTANTTSLSADREDLSVITVEVLDNKGRIVPTAGNDIKFTLTGAGKIIGVGNGDPSSHEAERLHETIITSDITGLKELPVENLENRPEVAAEYDDSQWRKAFEPLSENWEDYFDTLIVVRGTFTLPEITDDATVNFFPKTVVDNQTIYINGHLIDSNLPRGTSKEYLIEHNIIREGENEYAVVGQRFKLTHKYDEPNKDPGLLQVIYPTDQWTRKVFNGLAQILIQATDEPGEIVLKAESEGIVSDEIKIEAK